MSDELLPRREFATQDVQHPMKFIDQLEGRTARAIAAELQLDAKNQLGVEFGERSFGMRNELDEFASRMARLSFRNIGGDGNRRASHLRDEPKLFLRGKGLRDSINNFREGDSLLPNNQIFVTAGISFHKSSFTPAATTRHPSLATHHFSPAFSSITRAPSFSLRLIAL